MTQHTSIELNASVLSHFSGACFMLSCGSIAFVCNFCFQFFLRINNQWFSSQYLLLDDLWMQSMCCRDAAASDPFTTLAFAPPQIGMCQARHNVLSVSRIYAAEADNMIYCLLDGIAFASVRAAIA